MIKTKVMEIKHLNVKLKTQARDVPIVKDVSFTLYEGKVLGLIGESGCGKSATCQAIMGLLEKEKWNVEGSILLQGQQIQYSDPERLRRLRGDALSMILQNPIGSFNPLITLGEHFIETVRCHKAVSKKEARQIALDMLSKLNLSAPEKVMKQYPFQLSGGMLQRVMIGELLETVGLSKEDKYKYPEQFSGGQLQRVCIARALSVKPKLIILDEPLSSLDVSVQAQILNLLADLKQEFNLSYLFISHDIESIYYLSDSLAVMYLGMVVEYIEDISLFDSLCHPYTRKLLSSVLSSDPGRKQTFTSHHDELDKTGFNTLGCPYVPRCPKTSPQCNTIVPELKQVSEKHYIACHCYELDKRRA